jgi:hypothetical protein
MGALPGERMPMLSACRKCLRRSHVLHNQFAPCGIASRTPLLNVWSVRGRMRALEHRRLTSERDAGLTTYWSMILSESRSPLFGIML